MIRRLFVLGLAVLCAQPVSLVVAHAQTPYPTVTGPNGATLFSQPSLIWVQACNAGLGGFVGSTYGGSECLMPNSGSGGGGSNAAAGATGSSVPASAGYTGFSSGGALVGVSAANPLPVTGVSASAVGFANMATNQVSVGVTATLVLSARTGGAGTGRGYAIIENLGSTPVYCGTTSGITTSSGVLLPGSPGVNSSFPTTAAIYCVVASGSQTIAAVELY